MLADALGRPLRLILTPGQAGDAPQACALLEGQKAGAVLADTAYDSNALRSLIADMKAKAVIPSNPTRKIQIPHDAALYKLRNRIERTIGKLKQLRRIATRYDRIPQNYLASLCLAALSFWC